MTKLTFFENMAFVIAEGRRLLFSRNGREELLGLGVENSEINRINRLNRVALDEFSKNYPEVSLRGDTTSFDGGIQWDDNDFQACLLCENYEIESFYRHIEKKYPKSNAIKFYVGDGERRVIPYLFKEHRTHRDYIERLPTSLSIVLADLWLKANCKELYRQQGESIRAESHIEVLNYEKKSFYNDFPGFVHSLHVDGDKVQFFLALKPHQALLIVSDFLYRFNYESTLRQLGLNFSAMDCRLIKLFPDEMEIDWEALNLWKRVVRYRTADRYYSLSEDQDFHRLFEKM